MTGTKREPKLRRYDDPFVAFFERTKRADSGPLVGGVRCLEWTGALRASGHGQMRIRGTRKPQQSHRFAFATFGHKPIGDLCVLHKCDNPRCVEIAHLFLGTQLDNVADMMRKRRQAIGEHHSQAKLTDAKVREIRERRALGQSNKDIAKAVGASPSNVSRVASGDTWKHVV